MFEKGGVIPFLVSAIALVGVMNLPRQHDPLLLIPVGYKK